MIEEKQYTMTRCAIRELRKKNVLKPIVCMSNAEHNDMIVAMVSDWPCELDLTEKQWLYASMKHAIEWGVRSSYTDKEWKDKLKAEEEERRKKEIEEDIARKQRRKVWVTVRDLM